jgi:hypothetical protein
METHDKYGRAKKAKGKGSILPFVKTGGAKAIQKALLGNKKIWKKYGVFERRQQQIHVPEILMQI